MKFIIITLLGGFLGGLTGYLAMDQYPEASLKFYLGVNSELFSGLFTVSALLFSVKTYIVVKLQEGIYSQNRYMRKFAELSEMQKTQDRSHLDPLERLSKSLTTAVLIAALAAIGQIIAAALNSAHGVITGWSLAGASVFCLGYCWIQIRNNLNKYFDYLKEETNDQIEKMKLEAIS